MAIIKLFFDFVVILSPAAEENWFEKWVHRLNCVA
jgi:hypothetical protein